MWRERDKANAAKAASELPTLLLLPISKLSIDTAPTSAGSIRTDEGEEGGSGGGSSLIRIHSYLAIAPSSAALMNLPPSEVNVTLPFASAAVFTPVPMYPMYYYDGSASGRTTTKASLLNLLILSNYALYSAHQTLGAEVG